MNSKRTRGPTLARVRATALSAVALVACSSSSGGGGGASGAPSLGTLTPAANDSTVLSPFDATPDVDGKFIYFTALGANGAGVFKVGAGGGAITELFSGAPLVSPFSIAISTDGTKLFVADFGAETTAGDAGVIFSLPVGGGTPSDIAAADGMLPRGLEVSGDTLYFTGTTTNGSVGVFKMSDAGGAVSPLATGAPFQSPSGVAIASSGDVYVVDTATAGSARSRVVKVTAEGTASVYLDNLSVGYPAGIVLNKAESTLLVSALDPTKGTDAVLAIDVASQAVTEFSAGIDLFVEPAGLHRAKSTDIFAWADSAANKTGTVYVITQ
jgi:sugar lactone lactonase YvrE